MCPPGTIVDSAPPAPIASAHLDVAMNCTALATQCVQLALAATADDTLPRLCAGPSGQAALANHSWSYRTPDGNIDGWVLSESFQPGSSGGVGHDGSDLFANLVGTQHVLDFVDIEIIEAWYPMQVIEKAAAPGPHGAGQFRSGSGCRMAYRVSGDEHLTGAMFGMRETVPIGGVAGGFPGAPTEFGIRAAERSPRDARRARRGRDARAGRDVRVLRRLRRRVGRSRSIATRRSSASTCASGGSLTRRPTRRTAWCSTTPAPSTAPRTELRRAEIRRARLARALPAAVAVGDHVGCRRTRPTAIYRCTTASCSAGSVAVAIDSGAVLAVAPAHWTDGCPVLETERRSSVGAPWTQRTYLDPRSGRALHTEAVPPGSPRSFTTAPNHWIDA